MLNITCTNEQKVQVDVNPVTESGRPAQIDGPLGVEVVSGDGTFEIVTGEPNSFFAISGEGLGETVYRVFADADLGEGVVTIEDLVTLAVGGALARSLGLNSRAPVAK